MKKADYVNVIGAGLAGCEAALFLASKGIRVNLFDMKPKHKSPAHKSDNFAELVCSNSLKSTNVFTAGGLLKEELKELDCSLLKFAEKCKVPAGEALAVDRELFSSMVTEAIRTNPNISVVEEKVDELTLDENTILAAGPLINKTLYEHLMTIVGDNNCYFYDAIAPIVSVNSIDMNHAFWGNRYGKGETDGDYINCTLNREEYQAFYSELIKAQRAELKDFEKIKVFEGCMPIEILAERGFESLRFGPMKPVGLFDKVREERPFAVLQLRKEDELADSVNMVGFQTNLTYPEQKRVFALIPALKNAEYLRYGSMHRNSYVNAPNILTRFSNLKKRPNIYIAGQLSGVEGYVESIASGLISAYNMYAQVKHRMPIELPSTTCVGAILNYISSAPPINFQPMNANYGIIAYYGNAKSKEDKRKEILINSLSEIKKYKEKILNDRI